MAALHLHTFVIDARHRLVALFVCPEPRPQRYAAIVIEGDALTSSCEGPTSAPRRGLASTAIREVRSMVGRMRAVEALAIAALCQSSSAALQRFGSEHLSLGKSGISWSEDSMQLCASWARLGILEADPLVPGLAAGPVAGPAASAPVSTTRELCEGLRAVSSPDAASVPRAPCDAVLYISRTSLVFVEPPPGGAAVAAAAGFRGSIGGAQGLAWAATHPGHGLAADAPLPPVPTVAWRDSAGGMVCCSDLDEERHPLAGGLRLLLEAAGVVQPGAGTASALPPIAGADGAAGVPAERLYPWSAIPRHVLRGELSRAVAVASFMRARAELWGPALWGEASEAGAACSEGGGAEGDRSGEEWGSPGGRAARILAAAAERASRSDSVRRLVDAALARNSRILQQIAQPPPAP